MEEFPWRSHNLTNQIIKKVTFKNKALRIIAAQLDSKENMTNLCTTFSQIMNLQNIIYFIVFAIPSVLLGQEVAKDVDLEIQRRIKLEINPSISIGILLPDGAAKFYNYGQYDAEKKHKADSLTLYEIGSVTKTFTATLANLYSGQLLNTSISELFPECDNSSLEHITLEDLRNHVAGLPRLSEQFTPKNWSDPFNGYSDSLLNIELRKLKPNTIDAWSYSNFGYGIIGKAIEKTTKRNFEDLMGELLLRANMTNTLLGHPSEKIQRLAQPTNIGTENSYWNFTGPSRYAGGLISCTRDLVNYLKYQKLTNPLFHSDSLKNLIPTGIPDLGKDNLFYRDGWFVLKPESSTDILLHNGGTGGFTSFIAYNKKTEVGVVLLSNSVSLVDDIGLRFIYPEFELKRPERTIAYELADEIDKGMFEDLVDMYDRLKSEGIPTNIVDIYWLERYYFGKEQYFISNQLSDIMVKELPDDWEVYDLKGQNFEQLERYKEAEKAYKKALEFNPDNELIKEKIKRCTVK